MIMQRYVNKIFKNIENFLGWFVLPFGLFPINSNKIVVSSYYTRGYSDNPKAIVDELLRREDTRNYQIICITDSTKGLPETIIPVRPRSIGAAYHMRTAKVWIDNCRKSKYVRKREGQYYMQTWHGCALKKIERDALKSLEKYYVESAMNDSKMCDLIVSDSAHMTNIYSNSFWYDGEVITCGAPRTDLFRGKSTASSIKIRKLLNIPANKKIVTYAPTFRGDLNLSPYNIDYKKLQKIFIEKFGEEWVVLLRLHPNISERSYQITKKLPDIIDVSAYHDPQEILAISDVLITDYSSIMFDFMLTGRPGFLYANDVKSYTKDRDFYFDINELPYSLATNNIELFEKIANYDQEIQIKNINIFLAKIGSVTNGDASKIAVDRIKKWVLES